MESDPDGNIVGVVAKNDRGLYWVEHHPEIANIATEELTLDQFYRTNKVLSLSMNDCIRIVNAYRTNKVLQYINNQCI